MNVIITGSTRGLGLQMAKSFLSRGHCVTICGTNLKTLESAQAALRAFGGQTQFLLCDVRAEQDIENLWQQAKQKWGRIDIFINNAGVNQPHKAIADLDAESIGRLIQTNVVGMMNGSRIAAHEMRKQGSGAIYNMEGLGSNDMHINNTGIYGTSKRALTYFTIALAKEIEGSGVKVGRLSPGMMLTDFLLVPADGDTTALESNKSFVKTLNILADKPETVAEFLVPAMLKNTKNNAHIQWLTTGKTMGRFLKSAFVKRELVKT